MTQIFTVLAIWFTFFGFANISGTGAVARGPEKMVQSNGVAKLSQSRLDRCQMASFSSMSCDVCSTRLRTKNTKLALATASLVDLYHTLKTPMMTERLYRPPKA